MRMREEAEVGPGTSGEQGAESEYYLSDLEAYREGDQFPNVGYVRRMKALINQSGN